MGGRIGQSAAFASGLRVFGMSYAVVVKALVWMASATARAFCDRFAPQSRVVRSAQEFIDTPRDAETVAFLDDTTIALLDELAMQFDAEDVPPPEWRKLQAAVSLAPVILIF